MCASPDRRPFTLVSRDVNAGAHARHRLAPHPKRGFERAAATHRSEARHMISAMPMQEETMTGLHISRRAMLAIAATSVFATAAVAHHGWDWAEDEKFELTGTIQEIYIGNPHAVLRWRPQDGLWTVELAPPSRTRAAGFDENAAKAGDQVTAIGNRSRDQNEKRMKAVQIVVNGKTYDIYPDRIGRIGRCRPSWRRGWRRLRRRRSRRCCGPRPSLTRRSTPRTSSRSALVVGSIATLDLRVLGAFPQRAARRARRAACRG